LAEYFSNHYNDNWYHIPNGLFDIDKKLFVDAYEKLLSITKDVFLFESDSYLFLTSRLDILEYLIDNLSEIQSVRLRRMARIKSKHSTIKAEKRQQLIRLSNLY